ncbi:MAG: hypothetical protein K0U12_00455, partial [Gammaproteobacteria bacterium]|nr:hypothetical protein [Gammaproteobacteria bacterium]
MEKGAALLGWFGSFLPTLSAEPRIAESFSEAVEKRQDALEIEKECLVDQAQHRKLTIQLRSLQSIKSLHLFQKRQELKRKLTEFKTEYNKWYNKICRFIHKYLNKAKYELWEHDKETVDAVEEKLSKLDAKPVISERDVQDVKEQLENTLTRADNTGLKSYLRRSRVAFFVNPPPEEIRPQVQPRPDAAAGP